MGMFKSFPEMLMLTLAHHRQPSPFRHSILMGIFWEETLFGNVAQLGGGQGVGFGQVERKQFFWLGQPVAKTKGYFVPGVNTNTTQVNDVVAVQVASCILLHYFHAAKNPAGAVEFAYESYSGANLPAAVLAQTPEPVNTREKRLGKVQGWKSCAAALEAIPGATSLSQPVPPNVYVGDVENQILAALKLARDFQENTPDKSGTGITIRERLFPRYWQFTPDLHSLLPTFFDTPIVLQTGSSGPMVRLLQFMLNCYPVPDFMLDTDGFFGPQTREAVLAFQQWANIWVDGVVGPQTKAQLRP